MTGHGDNGVERCNWNSYDNFKEYDAHLTRLHNLALEFDINEARVVLAAFEDTHPELLRSLFNKENSDEHKS